MEYVVRVDRLAPLFAERRTLRAVVDAVLEGRFGLARAVAATLMLECLERGLTPHWNAANPVSQQLAVSLGYEPAEICEILLVAP
jgi:hypothetical protein